MIDGADFRATEIAALFIESGYRLRQNPTYTRNSPVAYDSLPLSYRPECCFQGSKGPHISAKMGAFGAWHYFHELHMSPPPDNPYQILDQRHSDRFQQHMDERFDALEKLIKSGFPDGNPEEHRKVHERHIKDAKEREEVRLAVKKSLYSSGIWLAILTLLAALASYFGVEVRK